MGLTMHKALSVLTIAAILAAMLLVFVPSGTVSAQSGSVTTDSASGIEYTEATLHGTIVDTGGQSIVRRGFHYGLTQIDTWDAYDSGTYGVGSYTKDITGLTAGEEYWYRAYFALADEERYQIVSGLDSMGGGKVWTRLGQRITIDGWTIVSLAFKLARVGSPTGDVTFAIRRIADDSVIASEVWGNASAIATDPTEYSVTFATPVYVNEEVRICAEFYGGDADNYLKFGYYSGNHKPGEFYTNYMEYGYWHDIGEAEEAGYKLTYRETTVGSWDSFQIISTDYADVHTLVADNTADLYGTIHGACDGTCAERGFQYGLTETPSWNVTELDGFGTGSYMLPITGLTDDEDYYFRAYMAHSTEVGISTGGIGLEYFGGAKTYTRMGQKVTISDRTLYSLSFRLSKAGSPTGDVTISVRAVSDDTALVSKVWGDAADVVAQGWHTVTFDSPVYVNEEVRLCIEYYGGDADDYLSFYKGTADLITGEYLTVYQRVAGNWHDIGEANEAWYKYTYSTSSDRTYGDWVTFSTTPVPPTVTTGAATDVVGETATLAGTLSDMGTYGSADVYFEYWEDGATVYSTADQAVTGAGVFEADLTSLDTTTTYYYRACADHDGDIAYGATRSFTTTRLQLPTDFGDTVVEYAFPLLAAGGVMMAGLVRSRGNPFIMFAAVGIAIVAFIIIKAFVGALL